MALQKIGLVAELDLGQFNRAFRKYMSSLDHLNSKTGGTANSLSGKFIGFGNSLLKVAGILSGAVLASIGLVAGAVTKLAIDGIKDAAELQQGIANIAAVMNITTDEAGFLRDVIIDLGINPQLKVSTFEAAEAMEILAKNGIFAGKSISEMESLARTAGEATILLANATGADFGQAAGIASTAMILFNRDASEMVSIVSDITAVTTTSKLNINDYELALQNGGAAAAIAGVSLEDFNQVIAASAEELGKGRKAGTGYMNFLNRLTPNSEKAKGVMEDLGLIVNGNNQFFDDATGELKDMRSVSILLNEALYGTSAVVSEVGGRTAEQNEALAQMTDEYKKAEQTIFDYTQGAKSLTATEEQRTKAIEEAQETMAQLEPTMTALNDITGDLIVSYETLNGEQRSVSLETIFGNDGMRTAIALANEGAEANLNAAQVMEIFGVNMQEANAMLEDGITNWDVMNATMGKTDALDNAATRTETLTARWENLKDSLSAIRLKVMTPLMELLQSIIEDYINPWIEDNGELFDSLEKVGESLSTFIEALIEGEEPFASLLTFLDEVGLADFGEKLITWKQSFEDFVTPIVEFVDQHSEALIGALEGIAIALGGFMILATIAGLVNLIINPITWIIAGVALLGAAWNENWFGIQETTQMVVETVTGLIDDIKSSFQTGEGQGSFASTFERLKPILDALAPVVDTLTVNFLQLKASFQYGHGIGRMAETFERIKAVGETLSAFFEVTMQSAIAALGTAWEGLKAGMEKFAPVIEQLKALWVTLEPLFKGIAVIVGTVLVGVFLLLQGILIGVFTAIANAIEPVITTIALVLEGIIMVVNGIITTLIGLGDVIIGFITGNNEKVQAGMTALSEGVTNIVLGLVQSVVSLFYGLVMTVVELVSGFVNGIIDFFTNLYNELVGHSIIPDMVNSILEWFGTLVADAIEAIRTWFSDMITTFTEKTAEILETIITWVKDIIAEYVELKDKVIEKVREWWDETISKIEEKVKEVVEKIETMVSDLVQIIVDAKEKFVTAGANIIDGVIEGVGQKLEEAKQAVLGVANGVKAAWDSFWNSQSPSKLMMESGQDIMKGAELGIQMQTPVLENVLTGAAAGAYSNFIGTVQNILPNSPVPISSTTTTTQNTFEVNNSFLDQPQITDANTLRLTLAGLAG